MDLKFQGAMMLFGSVISFFVFIYLLRFFFVRSRKEGFVTAPDATAVPITAAHVPAVTEPASPSGSSFTIQCPNSGAPIITMIGSTFQQSMNSFGAAGSGTADGLSGNPGSTPPSGVPSSTPAVTKKDDKPTSVAKDEDEDDTEYKPTLEKCKQYYSFDPKVDR